MNTKKLLLLLGMLTFATGISTCCNEPKDYYKELRTEVDEYQKKKKKKEIERRLSLIERDLFTCITKQEKECKNIYYRFVCNQKSSSEKALEELDDFAKKYNEWGKSIGGGMTVSLNFRIIFEKVLDRIHQK